MLFPRQSKAPSPPGYALMNMSLAENLKLNGGLSMKTTHTEELFVAEYLKNGQNGSRAYLSIKPNVSSRSARVSAHRLLKKPQVIELINNAVTKRYDESIASKEYLTEEAHSIGKDAFKKGKHGSALQAVELKGKLNKVFDKDAPEMDGYIKFIQAVMVNVNTTNDGEVIDVTPETQDKE